MDNFTIIVTRKTWADHANMLGRFSRPSVTALFVGCAHHRSWCFQRSQPRLTHTYEAVHMGMPPTELFSDHCLLSSLYTRRARVQFGAPRIRGWIYAYIRVHIQKPCVLILELTNVKDMFRERYRRRGSIVLWNEEVDEF